MSMISEFKEFAVKGNVMDMAIGIVIGAAFAEIVSAFVSGVILPPIGVILGGVNFSDLGYVIQEAAGETPAVTINYGLFLQTLLNFIIIAFAIFMVIKAMNSLKNEEEEVEADPEPTSEEVLLTEIRDLLKSKS